jgi:hypothetical protein
VTKSVAWHPLVENQFSNGDFDVIAEFLSLKTMGKPTITIKQSVEAFLKSLQTNSGKRDLQEKVEVQSFLNYILTSIVLPQINTKVTDEIKDVSMLIIDSIDKVSCKGDMDMLEKSELPNTLDIMRGLVELDVSSHCKKFQIVIERGRSLTEKCSLRVYKKLAQEYLLKELASKKKCKLEEDQLIWLARTMRTKRKIKNIEKLMKGSSLSFPLLASLLGFGNKLKTGYHVHQLLDELSKLIATKSNCKNWSELLQLMDGATKDGPLTISSDVDRKSISKFLEVFKEQCSTIFNSAKAEPYVKRLSALREAPGFFAWIFRL